MTGDASSISTARSSLPTATAGCLVSRDPAGGGPPSFDTLRIDGGGELGGCDASFASSFVNAQRLDGYWAAEYAAGFLSEQWTLER